MFYLIVFIILVFLSVLDVEIKAKNSKQFLLIIAATILILIAGLRVETGGDWNNYASIYKNCPTFINAISTPQLLAQIPIENGFLIFCSLIKQIGGSMQILLFSISLLNITLIAKSLSDYTKFPVLGLLCYYCILYFSLDMIYLRQAMAVAICFFSLRYIKQKNVWLYVLLILLATSMHRIAIVLLPFYWLLDKNISAKTYIIIMTIGMFIMLVGVLWLKPIFLHVSFWLGENFYNKALLYATEERFAVHRVVTIGYFLNILIFAAFMCFKKEIENLQYGKICLNMFCVSLIMYYYCYELIEVSNRVRLVFLIGIIALLPMLIEVLQGNMSKYIALIPVVLYCFSFSMHIFLEHPRAVAYNPYQNYVVMQLTNKKSTGPERLKKSKQFFDNERKR